MNVQDFEKIMRGINFRVESCEKYLGAIKSTEDLSHLSLADAKVLKEFCVNEEVIMTKIAMVDLYHVIGMANLTPTQMMKFTYRVRDYLQYRPSIKAIANHLESIFDLPVIPVTSRFKLLALCNLTLERGEGAVEEEASLEDYTNLKKPNDKIPFSLEDKLLTIPRERAREFIDTLSKLHNQKYSYSTFIDKASKLSEYLGVQWISFGSEVIEGNIKSPEFLKKIQEYLIANKL